MKYVINEISGNPTATFPAKLVQVSEDVFEMKNDKKTQYRRGTIEFIDENGVVVRAFTLVYEGNYQKGMKVGEEYLATAEQTERGVIVHTSHLTDSVIVTADMFNFDQAVAKSEVSEKALAEEVFPGK